jgi:hypothetical protein
MTQESFKLLKDILGDEILQTLLCVFKVSIDADGFHATGDFSGVTYSET